MIPSLNLRPLSLIVLIGRSIPSRELVPGDVYEVSDPSLDQVPCDCLLLSGDCIVNESMLTGLHHHYYKKGSL